MEKDIEMSHFDIDQQQEIKEGLQAGLDVSVYAKPELYAIQMRQIRELRVAACEGVDIILKEGTNAGGRGLLKAGGNVMGKFFENATIEAGGSVKANYCLNSNIVAGRNIIISGRYGMITGGNAYAGSKIESYNIGNAAGTAHNINIRKNGDSISVHRN